MIEVIEGIQIGAAASVLALALLAWARPGHPDGQSGLGPKQDAAGRG